MCFCVYVWEMCGGVFMQHSSSQSRPRPHIIADLTVSDRTSPFSATPPPLTSPGWTLSSIIFWFWQHGGSVGNNVASQWESCFLEGQGMFSLGLHFTHLAPLSKAWLRQWFRPGTGVVCWLPTGNGMEDGGNKVHYVILSVIVYDTSSFFSGLILLSYHPLNLPLSSGSYAPILSPSLLCSTMQHLPQIFTTS